MAVLLDSIQREALKDGLAEINSRYPDIYVHSGLCLVTLTNGDSFIAFLQRQCSGLLVTNNDAIEVALSPERSCYIPLSDISGVIAVDLEQERNEDKDAEPVYCEQARGAWFRDASHKTIEKNANQFGWIIGHFQQVQYEIRASKPFEWGKLRFYDDTPLYWDRDYLLNQSKRKIKSMGIGVLGFSASVGWSEGLWNDFKNLFDVNPISFGDDPKSGVSLVSGYVDFFEFKCKVSQASSLLEMDGKRWFPGIISKEPIDNSTRAKTYGWHYCFFKEDGFFLDKSVWGNISEAVSVVCEYMPMSLASEYGERDGFFKARAASYFA